MNLAIKIYRDTDNPQGLPEEWPAETIDLGESTTLPEGPWTLMTSAELGAYLAARQELYNAWYTAFTESLRPLKPPMSKTGAPIIDTSYSLGLPGATSVTINSHDYSDRTTWYQRSVKVTDEVLSDSGNGLTFNSANPWWVNMNSPRLTYDYKSVPERDGSFSDKSLRFVVVKVDDAVVTSGYSVNYVDGKIVFESSQNGHVVKATYYHTNEIDRRSEWVLNPPPTQAYLLQYIETQFSKSIVFASKFIIEAWAGADIDTYGDFEQEMFDAGYGQNKSVYQGARDFLNICTNRSSQIIPPFGGLEDTTIIFPFDYLIQTQIRSSQGTVLAISLSDDVPYGNCEIATATFYMQLVPEASLPEEP